MKKRFTEEEYNAMRILIGNGATNEMLSKVFNVGTTLVTRVRKASSWDEYRQLLNVIAADARKKKQEKATKDEKVTEPNLTPAISPAYNQQMASNYQINRLYEMLKEQNEYLKLISAKLVFIVESLA